MCDNGKENGKNLFFFYFVLVVIVFSFYLVQLANLFTVRFCIYTGQMFTFRNFNLTIIVTFFIVFFFSFVLSPLA